VCRVNFGTPGGDWICLSVAGVCHSTSICGNWGKHLFLFFFPPSSGKWRKPEVPIPSFHLHAGGGQPPLYMFPHAAIYMSLCCYICVLILLYMCPHTTICVLMLLYVSSLYYICVCWITADTGARALVTCFSQLFYFSQLYFVCSRHTQTRIYECAHIHTLATRVRFKTSEVTGTKVLQKCKLLVLKYFDKPGSCSPTQSLWTPDIVERCTHTPRQLVSSTMHSFAILLQVTCRNSSEIHQKWRIEEVRSVCVCVCVCVCVYIHEHIRNGGQKYASREGFLLTLSISRCMMHSDG
jgi:hypothetical protein